MANAKTKCVVCCQDLGSKKQLLHGTKCLRFGVHKALKSFLDPSDLKTLYNRSLFPDPGVCNLCLVTIRQIPSGINKLQELLGGSLNLTLYSPHRQDWNDKLSNKVDHEITQVQHKLTAQARHLDTLTQRSVETKGAYQAQPSDATTTFLASLETVSPPAMYRSDSERHKIPTGAVFEAARETNDKPKNTERDVIFQHEAETGSLEMTFPKIRSSSPELPEKRVTCEISACNRMFTSRAYMKRHLTSYHKGRRPGLFPGVLFFCKVEGCGKKFSKKQVLCRHNLLVHKGGDYKLNRTLVMYPCPVKDCEKVFNRKNLLEDHRVAEHGEIPKLSRQSRKLDYTEKMCAQCGQVSTVSQHSRHQSTCLSSISAQDTNMCLLYFCHLDGCGMTFSIQTELQTHVESHQENPPYQCGVEECKETFFLLKNFDNHLWNHSKQVSTCDVPECGQTFDDQLQLGKHSKVHYDGKMKCPWRNCRSLFVAMGTLKQHFLSHSRSLKANFGWDFVCDKCDRVFKCKYGLHRHRRFHEENSSGKQESSPSPKFLCEEAGCSSRFTKHKEFFDHFLLHYTNQPTACDYGSCTETFSNMLLQSKHGKNHYGGKYKCPWQECDKMFASSFFQVKKHVYKHLLSIPIMAANRPYACPQCGMVFRLPSNLTRHMEQHPEKSDYVCPVCGKKFRHNHLKRHMLTHKQDKPHVCSHCGVCYSTVNGLKFHIIQIHKIGEWPYKCSYCEKGFISSTELHRHLPSHTKEKPFSCKLCGDTFATHTGHRGHMRKHTGQKYVCDVEGCGKVYNTPLSLRGHKAEHAGFSMTCSHCGRTYRNPYGHKCKASRETKQREIKDGYFQPKPVVLRATMTDISESPPSSVINPLQQWTVVTASTLVSQEIMQIGRNSGGPLAPTTTSQANRMAPTTTNQANLMAPTTTYQAHIMAPSITS